MKERHTLVLIYNSFKDPLFQNLMLKYISKLAENPYLKFHLVTFEQPQYRMTKSEIVRKKADLARQNIYWEPLQFHTGRLLMLKKAWDFVQLMAITLHLKRKYNLRYIMAFANVSAALSGILTILFDFKLIIYSYEPHAKFMIDMGHWTKSDLKFKVLNYLEKLAAKKAFHIMTGTHAMKDELSTHICESKISVAPTAVDPIDFQYSEFERNNIRSELNARGKKIILYIGKFGGLYYDKEIIQTMCTVSKWDKNIFPLVITDFNHQKINQWIEEYGGKPHNFLLMNAVSKEKVSAYLSAADLGIIGIPPLTHQKFRSPTKTAEYLLCGLPTLICDGISEDSHYIDSKKLGCVVRRFSPDDIIEKKEEILSLFEISRKRFLAKSRTIAKEYRSIEKVNNTLNKIYKEG